MYYVTELVVGRIENAGFGFNSRHFLFLGFATTSGKNASYSLRFPCFVSV